MPINRIIFITVLLLCNAALASDYQNLVCSEKGLAGINFGQTIEEQKYELQEKAFSGVAYYLYDADLDISPFKRVIVGITPKSRRVFSIDLEMHGDRGTIHGVIDQIKKAFDREFVDMRWRVIGNSHYSDEMGNLDLVLNVLGDLVDGQPTYLLSYSCDNRSYRKLILEEMREALGYPTNQ